jgi:hypothetical protein
LVLALQIAFYGLALLDYLWQRKAKAPRVLGISFSFCLVNLAALVGVARFVMGKKVGVGASRNKPSPLGGGPFNSLGPLVGDSEGDFEVCRAAGVPLIAYKNKSLKAPIHNDIWIIF